MHPTPKDSDHESDVLVAKHQTDVIPLSYLSLHLHRDHHADALCNADWVTVDVVGIKQMTSGQYIAISESYHAAEHPVGIVL